VNPIKLLKSVKRREDDLHLQSAIETLLDRLTVANQMTITFDAALFQQNELTPKMKRAIFRTVQTRLHSIAKYSDASEVYVSLDHTRERAYLVIRDNGRGAGMSPKWAGGYISCKML